MWMFGAGMLTGWALVLPVVWLAFRRPHLLRLISRVVRQAANRAKRIKRIKLAEREALKFIGAQD